MIFWKFRILDFLDFLFLSISRKSSETKDEEFAVVGSEENFFKQVISADSHLLLSIATEIMLLLFLMLILLSVVLTGSEM